MSKTDDERYVELLQMDREKLTKERNIWMAEALAARKLADRKSCANAAEMGQWQDDKYAYDAARAATTAALGEKE